MIGDYILLADPSACLRFRALREIFGKDDRDEEVVELYALREEDSLVASLVELQREDGAWEERGKERYDPAGRILITAYALLRLGYLGYDASYLPIQRGAEFLFSQQEKDGSWPLTGDIREAEEAGKYTMIPLQTSLPLRGLAATGFATDTRAELAYEWLLTQRLPDGAWPTGIADGNFGGVAGYRRLPHSRLGCRSSTTGALICLALHPQRSKSEAAHRALDHLLARETHEASGFGFDLARILGFEAIQGMFTHFAHFDLALLLKLSGLVGATKADSRVADLAAHILAQRGPHGLWAYRSNHRMDRWLTFDILQSLARLDINSDWIGLEPRTPFQAYRKRMKRY